MGEVMKPCVAVVYRPCSIFVLCVQTGFLLRPRLFYLSISMQCLSFVLPSPRPHIHIRIREHTTCSGGAAST